MLNKQFIAVISVICVLAIALPVFAHEGSGSGQRDGERMENCTAHGSGSSEDNAGGSRGRKYDVQGRIYGNSQNSRGPRFSGQNLTGNKDGSGNGSGRNNYRNEHKVNNQGQGPRDGSGRERQGSTGQGRKCGLRDGSGEGRGQGFKDGYHRNRK